MQQIFDEMIKKINTLLCIQEFIKDRELMQKYFQDEDIEHLKRYCSSYTYESDLNDLVEDINVNRLIQMLLSTNLHLHSDQYKDNVS